MPDDRYYPISSHEELDGPRYYELEGELKKTYAINNRHLFKLPRVFTIFCHGTGGHRYGRCKEFVTELHSAYWNRLLNEEPNEFYKKHYQNSFLVLDGVGTSDHTGRDGKPVGLPGPPHPMPGNFWPCALEKTMKPSKKNTNRDFFCRVSEMWIDGHTGASSLAGGGVKHRGDVFGDGWNDNVAHALYVLNELLKKDQFPNVINMTGWSRGGVTTIKLASAIQNYFVDGNMYMVPEKYEQAHQNLVEYPGLEQPFRTVNAEDISLNLFAIDPVPGRFGKNKNWGGSNEIEEIFPTVDGDQDYRSLPPIVKKCVITLAMDERRSGFAPICAGQLAYGEESKVIWLPYPGIHRTQVRMEPRDPAGDDRQDTRESLTAVPHLVFDMAWKFLTSNGTVFERNLLEEEKFGGGPLSLESVVELYSNVWLNRAAYHETRNEEKMLNLKWRKFTGYRAAPKQSTPNRLGRNKEHKRERNPVLASALFTEAMRAYTDFPGFFINMHHQACFQQAYPDLYVFLTTENDNLGDGEFYQIPHGEGTYFDLDTIFGLDQPEPEVKSDLQKALMQLGFEPDYGQVSITVKLITQSGEPGFVPGPYLADPGKPVVQPDPDEEGGEVPTFTRNNDLILRLGLLDYPEEQVAGDDGGGDGDVEGGGGDGEGVGGGGDNE